MTQPQTIGAFEILARDDKAGLSDDVFTELVRRQSLLVFRVAYSLLRNTQDAEDVVQGTFLKLYRLRAWNGMDDERAFLSRMAWRLAVDLLRTRRKHAEVFDLTASGKNPEQTLIAADRNAVVWRLIDALPCELRQPLALSTVEEFSSPQIAEILGIPEGTVRTRLLRARQILKQKLAAHLGEPK